MTTDRFSISLTPANGNNIVLLLDLKAELIYYEQFKAENIVEHSIILEDLQAKVGLFSLVEAGWIETTALASEAQQEAARAKIMKEGQKVYLEIFTAKGNGPWQLEGEEILQNKNSLEQPWALMAPFFSTNETALLGESMKIGVRIANKAQGAGGLKGNDYIRIFGSWRKVTKIEPKKKDNDNEELAARINALENLLSIFGAPSTALPGSNGLVPAPPAGSSGEKLYLKADRSWENLESIFSTFAGDNIFGGIITILKDLILKAETDGYNTFRYVASNGTYCDIGIAPGSLNRDFYISFQAAGGGVNGFRINSVTYDLLMSGNLSTLKSINAGGSIIPSSPPGVAWGVDYTQGGSTIILPVNSTYDLATGSGQVTIYDNVNGNFLFAFCTAGNVVAVSATANGSIVAGSPPAGKVGLFYNAGTAKYRLSNLMSDRTLVISTVKIRGAS